MNYATIVDKFKTIILDHKIIHDFGYGELSDIKVLAEDAEGVNDADYPYAFLNPAGVTQSGAGRVYSFNLILMEMVINPLETVNVQSRCIQYIDDIIAGFNSGTVQDVQLQYTSQVFKERFQDEVAGATASIQVRDLNPLNNCITPARPPVQFVLDVESDRVQLFRPDVSQNPQGYQITNVDTYNGMRPVAANFYQINGYIPTTGDWVFTETGTAVKISGTDPFTNPRILVVRNMQGVETQILPDTSTFPDDAPLAQPFDYKCTWNIQLDPAEVDYIAIQDYDDVATEPIYETNPGTKLIATYQPL
jgi:hypothetical protein